MGDILFANRGEVGVRLRGCREADATGQGPSCAETSSEHWGLREKERLPGMGECVGYIRVMCLLGLSPDPSCAQMQAAVPNPTAPPSSQPHPIVPSMDVPKHSVMDQPAPEPPVSDAASVHSMPAVRITEPATPVDQARSPVSNEFSSLSGRAPPASPVTPTSRSNTPQEDSTSLTQQQRRARHRSAIEVSTPFHDPQNLFKILCSSASVVESVIWFL